MDTVKEVILKFNWDSLIKGSLRVTMILFFTWILIKVIHQLIRQLEKYLIEKSEKEGEPPSESEKRINTIIRLVRQAALLSLWVTVALILLKEFGVEIGPIIASAGIVGLAVGFGAQNLVKDVISGFFMILENQIRVGDVAVVNGKGGLVEKINFRTIVLRDLAGAIHVFPNGSVTTLSNLTHGWSAYVFDIGVAYRENIDHVIQVLKEVGANLFEDSKFGPFMLAEPEIFGLDKMGDSSIVVKGRIRTKPIRQWDVGREFLKRVKLCFDDKGIEIPFPQRTFTFDENAKPFEIKIVEKTNSAE